MPSTDDLERLASDLTSSATMLLDRVHDLLRRARAGGPGDAERTAAGVCRAQPSMGSVLNLAAALLSDDPDALERVYRRAKHAPDAIARHVLALFADGGVRRIVTCSRSAAVERCAAALGARAVAVRCAESRPGGEGRALAAALAARGVAVELVSDAGAACGYEKGDVVLVGADAVARGWFVNKAGTGALCAAATLAGVPAYVLAGREKFLGDALAGALTLRQADPAAVWADPPPGVTVRHPLFERVPLEWVAGVVTDAGLLAGDMIAAACEAVVDAGAAARLRAVLSS